MSSLAWLSRDSHPYCFVSPKGVRKNCSRHAQLPQDFQECKVNRFLSKTVETHNLSKFILNSQLHLFTFIIIKKFYFVVKTSNSRPLSRQNGLDRYENLITTYNPLYTRGWAVPLEFSRIFEFPSSDT